MPRLWHLDDRRIPILLWVPEVKHWASCEPLLEPLNLRPYLWRGRLDWTVVGSESGQHHRPMQFDWCYDLMQQCREAGAASFMKQVSGQFPKDDMIPADLMVRNYPT